MPSNNEPGNEQPQHDSEYVDDNASLTSSQEDQKMLEEAAGVDLRAAPAEHSGRYVMIFWNVFSLISFVFMLVAACPVPWLSDSQGRKWTIWKNADGTTWKDYPCAHKRQMFQAMEAFSIAGCIFSLGCLIAGVLQMRGRGHLGVMMLLGVVTMVVELVDWALIVNQYHKKNCLNDDVYVAKVNRLSAGFCLVLISFSLMLFGITALVYWLSETMSLSEMYRGRFNPVAIKSAFVAGSLAVIATVGTAQNMWEHYNTETSLKITYWHVEIFHRTSGLSEHWPLSSYHCSAFETYMRAGVAFSIISDVFLFFTFLATLGAVYSHACKWVAVGLGAVSWVVLLICWAITISVRFKTFCGGASLSTVTGTADIYGAPLASGEQVVNFQDFVITEGLGMIISAWCFTTANIIYFSIWA